MGATVVAAALGMLSAVVMAPVLARSGKMGNSTAFFALLPGGVIEVANLGEGYGADRTIVAALHAVRVGLVVGMLPLALFLFGDASPVAEEKGEPLLSFGLLLATLCFGLLGGWLGLKAGMPAAWLLGALILVALVSSTGALSGRLPDALLAAVQVLVGMSLGARFRRSQLAGIPRALAVSLPAFLVIMGAMALVAVLLGLVMPFELPTLILCLSIGGMAEMVLTSEALGQNVALVAAFQAVRGVLVNASAGLVRRRIVSSPNLLDSPKG